MARDMVLTIKVSAEEKARIVEAARRSQRTYSDWSRLVLTRACDELDIPLDAQRIEQQRAAKEAVERHNAVMRKSIEAGTAEGADASSALASARGDASAA